MATRNFPSPCVEWTPKIKLTALKGATFQWSEIIRYSLFTVPDLGLRRIQGAIFSGPPGNGRHTTAEALAGSLAGLKYNYWLRISGCALDCEEVADACAVIDAVANTLSKAGKICLLLDAPEQSRHSLAIQEYLGQLLEQSGENLFPIIITDDPTQLSPNLLRRFPLYHCPKPDLAARQLWFEKRLKNPQLPVTIDGLDHWMVSRETEDFSWRQLQDLYSFLLRSMFAKYASNPASYNPSMLPEAEKEIWSSGKIHLSKTEVFGLITAIRAQNAAAAPANVIVAGPAAPAQPTAASFVPTGSITADTPGSPAAPHKKAEEMTPDELIDGIDDL